MQTLTKLLRQQGLADKIINVHQLSRLVDGSDKRRYALVNRALKKGEVIQLQRGFYVLSDHYRKHNIHPFSLAQGLAPGSYISVETALSYHGWIPEKVFTFASIVPGRKSKKYANDTFGFFDFHPLATNKGFFLELVSRYHVEGQTALIATPVRALMDLICLRKVEWQGLDWLVDSLRINSGLLQNISPKELHVLKLVYKHKQMTSYISSLNKELFL